MGASLSGTFVNRVRDELRARAIDGWLLYDFRGNNRVAADLLGMPEGQKRRYFVLLGAEGVPTALVHRIELSGWDEWEYRLESYVGWEELETALGRLLEGAGNVAMEVSPRDGVPYVDNVPAGVVGLVESLGPAVVSSVDLVSGTVAQWGESGLASHTRAAEIVARTARGAFEMARAAAGGGGGGDGGNGGGSGLSEFEIAEWVRSTLESEGLTEADTIVAVGANAAKPHYEPRAEGSARIRAGEVFMVDLWARVAGEPAAVFADQTWMGFLGPELPDEVARAWEAVSAARDGAVELIRAACARGEPPTGAEVDRRAREILTDRGYAEAIAHRTGHSLDREIHGIGPNIDAIETRDERRLVPGIGFSIEPGAYFDGRFGLRTEINVYMGDDGPLVTPSEIQHDMWLSS